MEYLQRLEDQVALIFGATSGIGEACSRRFAAEGATVVLTGRRIEKGEAVVGDIIAKGGKASFKTNDMRDIEAAEKVVDEVFEEFGKLDILHVNGGIGGGRAFGELTMEGYDDVMNTNLRPYVFIAQHAVPYLEKTKGKILFTSSLGAVSPKSCLSSPPYGMSKAALTYFAKQLAVILGPKGIRVNCLGPGLTKTEIFLGKDAIIDKLAQTVPLRMMAEAEDQANVAAFLVSDEARFMTGQTVVNCGGMSFA